MYKHRLVFLGIWLLGIVALLIYPGFEAKGFIWGTIIGYWPFIIWGELSHGTMFIAALVLSAIEIGFCAWMLDKWQVSRKFWYVLLFSIIAGLGIIFCLNVDKFDTYKNCIWIQAAENSPELNYEFTRSDFNRIYLMPATIVGGMYGLYFATALGVLYANGVSISQSSTGKFKQLASFETTPPAS